VVDSTKCAGCHEWLEAHGGNRVAEAQVCVACHVPGLATSGRGIADTVLNPWNFNIAQTKILTDWKFDKTAVNAALKFPVTSNNFKDMIHGIHAGRDRVTPFQDARDSTSRGSIDLLDFRRMDFPGKLNNCETCHVTYTGVSSGPGSVQTYAVIPAGSLVSTYESLDWTYYCAAQGKGYTSPNLLCDSTPATATPKMAKDSLARANVTDTVSTPFTAACVSCHDGSTAKAHMSINGGSLNVTRAAAQPDPRPIEDVESCAVCHGPGREFDTAKVHK
jgi:OmcA/MtrC family decaheme c-type cytochrome